MSAKYIGVDFSDEASCNCRQNLYTKTISKLKGSSLTLIIKKADSHCVRSLLRIGTFSVAMQTNVLMNSYEKT